MDGGVASRIARAVCEDCAADLRIVEIGPGTGRLTGALLAAGCADITAIDVDPHMIRMLREQKSLAAVRIVEADALRFDYTTLGAAGPWSLTGNLPYNIATPLVTQCVEMRNGPNTIVVMVQKDVADRFAARPGSKAYGSLSVAVQYAMRVQRLFTILPSAFYPRPKVSSTVVRLHRLQTPAVNVSDERRFRQVVRAAFAYRRKTLANSLSLVLGLPRTQIIGTLSELNLNAEIRGEQLGLDDFARLANRLPA